MEKSHRDKQLEQLHLCAEIGRECTEYDPRKRPDARTIVLRLHDADLPIVQVIYQLFIFEDFNFRILHVGCWENR